MLRQPRNDDEMARILSTRNLLEKKYKTFSLQGLWKQAMGEPERSGNWIIYGAEKHGKTWFSLQLADTLSNECKVLYISAEEGMSKTFREAVKRANITSKSKLQYAEYTELEELDFRLRKKRSPDVVFFDNATIYNDDFRGGGLKRLMLDFPQKLFVIIAHEEKGAPYTALGKLASKLAKIIIRVEGLTAFISGRCPGGVISINETKSQLYWGTDIADN